MRGLEKFIKRMARFEVVTVYSSVIEQPDPRHLNQM